LPQAVAGGWGGGSGAAEPKGGEETILNEKVLIFCSQKKKYKFLSQIKGNPIKNLVLVSVS